jgi:hypothetical protein
MKSDDLFEEAQDKANQISTKMDVSSAQRETTEESHIILPVTEFEKEVQEIHLT